MSLLVIGTIALDTVYTPFGKNANALGGSAVYASISASYFTDVKVISIIGEDFPKKHLRMLKDKRIDLSGIETKRAKTFRWEGKYGWDLSSAQTLATHLNVLSDFRPKLSDCDKKYNFIFLANNDPQIQLDIISQAGPDKIIAADTIEFWIKNKRRKLIEVLERIDIFILNEDEARLLTKEPNLIKAAKKIISCGTKKVIIKKGEHGVIYFTNKELFACPGYPLENVYDPTGAGDSFAGGFLGFLANRAGKMGSNKNLNSAYCRRALIYGSIMASYNVEGFDIKVLSRLNRNLIEKRYREFERLVRF